MARIRRLRRGQQGYYARHVDGLRNTRIDANHFPNPIQRFTCGEAIRVH
jgi:hypothetical protein